MSAATAPARFLAVIPCAGTGSRAGAGGVKQYRPVVGQALVWHTLAAFRTVARRLDGVWLAVAPDDDAVQGVLPDFPHPGEHLARCGGASRAETVRNALDALLAAGAAAHDWVLVHDAARCLVTPAQIESLIAACEHDAVGGLLAQPLADTLKAATPDGRVAATLAREGKWLAQTPQMFRLGALAAALDAALADPATAVTDEAGAMEAAGFQPLLVAAGAQNIKVTYPDDFALAEAVLRSRGAVAP